MAGMTAEVRARIMERLVDEGFTRRDHRTATFDMGHLFAGRIGLGGGRSGIEGGYSLQVTAGVTHEGILGWDSELTGAPNLKHAPVIVRGVDPGRRPSLAWEFMPSLDPARQIDHVVKRILRVGLKFYRQRSSLDGFRAELEYAPGNSAVLLPIVLSMMGNDEGALAYVERCRTGRAPRYLILEDYERFAEAFAAACPLAIEGPPT